MRKFASSIVHVILRLKAEESRPTKGNEILRSCLAQDDMAVGKPFRINGRLYLGLQEQFCQRLGALDVDIVVGILVT